MNLTPQPTKTTAPKRRPPLLLITLVIVVVLLLYLWLRPGQSKSGDTAYHEVKRGDFTVSVVEGGNLAAVSEVSIRNEVEGTARIISIVPEGSYVKKGDLLVELDSAQARDQVNQQEINYAKAEFAVEQAEAQLAIQKSATNSEFLAAQLKVKFAEIDLDKYIRGQRLVDFVEASNKVLQARNQLAVNLDTYINSTNLASKGYETKMKVDGDGLSVTNSRNSLIVATNSMWMLQEFDMKKLEEKYRSDLMQSQQDLDRTIIQNKRRMAQYEADLETQKNTLKLSNDKLERDRRNLTNCVIRAPQDGLVVYQVSENRFSSESLIEGGATVRNRQELIKLPDLSRMKVTVKIHESHINMIRPGLPAYVVLDSAPDIRYAGVVQKVAPLPDTQARWGNPNLKVYNTDVYLTENVPNVKPGVSAKAEIIITNVADTLSIPIQAITTFKGKQAVYLLSGEKAEPKPVEVGMFNTKYIEITGGLKAGDRVLLSPPFELQEKDLEGAVLADEEKSRVAKTNKPPRLATEPRAQGQTPEAAPNGTAAPDVRAMTSGPGGNAGPNGSGDRQNRGPGGFNREEMMKQYDKNGDGELDETEREAMRSAMAARFGGQGGPGGQGGQGRGPGGFNREEMMKQYDKNGDGELDETEREAMRSAMAARFGGQGGPGGQGGQGRGPGGFNREEMMKQFDKNGDGELDETERAAMRESFGGSRTNRTDRRRGGEGDDTSGQPSGRERRNRGNGGGQAPSEPQ